MSIELPKKCVFCGIQILIYRGRGGREGCGGCVGDAVAFEKAPQSFQIKKDKGCTHGDILHREDFERSSSAIVLQVILYPLNSRGWDS